LVAIGHLAAKKIKYWDHTGKIGLTPHLSHLYKLRAGDISEFNVGFFELNQSGVDDDYVNKFNYKWAPRLRDYDTLKAQWKDTPNWMINYTIGLGSIILQVLCKLFQVTWTPMIQDFWLKDEKETWITKFCNESRFQTARGKLNSPAMQAYKHIKENIIKGTLTKYDQIKIFFRAQNFVPSSKNNFVDVPISKLDLSG
jgi:hypothetical protein